MSPQIFETLERSLKEKVEGLERLITLAVENREALITHNVDEIIRLNQLQTEELSRLDLSQRSSSKLLARMASALGLDANQATITVIAASLPEAQRKRLEALSTLLTDKASELATVSEINASLSANALDFIRFTMHTISAERADSDTQGAPRSNSLVLDVQV